jgi:hypothetical protein
VFAGFCKASSYYVAAADWLGAFKTKQTRLGFNWSPALFFTPCSALQTSKPGTSWLAVHARQSRAEYRRDTGSWHFQAASAAKAAIHQDRDR